MPDQFIENNVEFERKWHRFEQVAWIGLVALLMAACFGYFGRGPQARRTAVASDGSLSVTYDRVLRSHAQSDIELIVESNASGTSDVQVRLAGAWLTSVPYLQMLPEPASSTASRDSTTYTFRSEAGRPARIRFVQGTTSIGQFRSIASVPGRADVVIEQVVLP